MIAPAVWMGAMAAVVAAATTEHADEVEVELASTNPSVTLNRVTGQTFAQAGNFRVNVSATATSWEMVCVIPCRKALDRNAQYFVAGAGVTESAHFLLPPAQQVTLRVEAGSALKRVLGITATVVGAVLGAAGLILGLIDATSRFEADRGHVHGWIMAGLGGGMLIPGLIMWLTSGTSVTTLEGPKVASGSKP